MLIVTGIILKNKETNKNTLIFFDLTHIYIYVVLEEKHLLKNFNLLGFGIY